MIVTFEDCNFRINGVGTDWQIQYRQKRNGEEFWNGRYFFPSLDFAISKAYELMLIKSSATVDVQGAVEECKRVKDALVKAVRRAKC